MRKRITEQLAASSGENGSDSHLLPFESIAEVEITSEHPDRPIEGALSGTGGRGWVAGSPGEQTIIIVFDEPSASAKGDLRVC
jgi:hypothetical protein